jgi:hypothetical protein
MINGFDKLPEVLRRSGVPEEDLGNTEFMERMRESSNWIMEPLKVSGAFDFGNRPLAAPTGQNCFANPEVITHCRQACWPTDSTQNRGCRRSGAL